MGTVTHTINVIHADGASKVVLDSSGLLIDSVTDGEGRVLHHQLSDRHSKFGTAINIQFKHINEGETQVIKVNYETTKECTALQWLKPAQTVGLKFPYMFSQCQAIHARSLFPCQDTPGVKFTYTGNVKSSIQDLLVLMSAVHGKPHNNVFTFEQKIAVPSYLVAIAVGNLKGISVGPRTTVWSEPEVVEQAAWEFEDTEDFLKIGEELLTPYEWGICDLLVLPASFPYGGMENPCLTFVTPTLLAGDRSLVDVVAHEIAHSWMGNLVTTVSWEHFWLNEGFTVFIERKITSKRSGEPTRHFNAILGLEHLKESLDHFEKINCSHYSCLCPSLKETDPDDVFSSVPYEKGFNLLFYLETLLGGPTVFDKYLKAHVTEFAHKSISTSEFKRFLFEYFEDKVDILNTVDWESWFHKPGMPPVANVFDQTLTNNTLILAEKWKEVDNNNEKTPSIDNLYMDFNTNQKVLFLEKLCSRPPFQINVLEQMDVIYNFSGNNNAEIKCKWLILCLLANHSEMYSSAVKFVTSVGRMKFTRTVYRALFAAKGGKEIAVKAFLDHRSFYHPICASLVAKDLHLSEQAQ